MTLTAQIFEAIKSSEAPVSVDAIVELIPITVDKRTVAAIVSQRKKAGELVVTVEGGKACYSVAPGHDPATRRIAAKGGVPVRPRLAMRAPPLWVAPTEAARATVANEPQESAQPTLQEAFERNRDTALAALDAYIAGIADPVIYKALKRAVVQSQRALDAFNAGATV